MLCSYVHEEQSKNVCVAMDHCYFKIVHKSQLHLLFARLEHLKNSGLELGASCMLKAI